VDAHASRDAIAALIYGYAERLDDGDLDGVARLFAHATFRSSAGGRYTGTEQVREALRRALVLHDGRPRTKHATTNLVVEVDEAVGTATARSYFTVLQATPTLPLQVVIAGRYHDRFERVDGGWRFADRLVLIDLEGDLHEHVRGRS
jgi:3-phenylpropionate/cinnamic acid dioxygenase small subunit